MSGVIKKHIIYPGVETPATIAEIKVEVCGLNNAIKIAEELISRYEQVLSIMAMRQEAMHYASQKKNVSEVEKSGEGAASEKEGPLEPLSEEVKKESKK
jgi:hypothetical protein